MKIALFGGTGRTGRRILDAALIDGNAVTVLARNPSKLPPGKYKLTIQLGDALDEDAVDDTVYGQEAVISALGLTDGARADALSAATANVVKATQMHGIMRLIVIAGAGILQDRTNGGLRMDAPDFPPALLPYAREHRRIYEQLGKTQLDWTLVCAPYLRDEPATGQVRVEVDCLPEGGRSATFADVAKLAYGLALGRQYIGQRVGIAD